MSILSIKKWLFMYKSMVYAVIILFSENGLLTVFFFLGPSIFLVVSGSLDISCNSMREELCEGAALFVSASTELKLYPKLSKDILVFQAYCSL